jgi:hypothetical protein
MATTSWEYPPSTLDGWETAVVTGMGGAHHTVTHSAELPCTSPGECPDLAPNGSLPAAIRGNAASSSHCDTERTLSQCLKPRPTF